MQIDFHNRQTTVIALAIGGLIGLGKELVTAVTWLFRQALTQQGLAAIVVASFLVSVAALVVGLIRR